MTTKTIVKSKKAVSKRTSGKKQTNNLNKQKINIQKKERKEATSGFYSLAEKHQKEPNIEVNLWQIMLECVNRLAKSLTGLNSIRNWQH